MAMINGHLEKNQLTNHLIDERYFYESAGTNIFNQKTTDT